MDQSQPNFGGQNSVNLGGAQGDFSGFGMNGVGGNAEMGGGAGFGGAGMGGGMNASGDVVFTSSDVPGKSGKKKFVIIGILLSLVVVGCVVAIVVFGGGGGGLFGGSSLPGFKELSEYIEKGDEETRKLFGEEETKSETTESESEEEDEFIMAIRIAEKGETEVKKYYKKLATLEQTFYKQSAGKVDSSLMAEYGSALKVMRNAIDYYDVKDELISAYESGGETEAEAYFDENIKCGTGAGDLASVCELEEKYYTAVLTEHKVYAEAGCYKSNLQKNGWEYDVGCAIKHYGSTEYRFKITKDGEALSFLARVLGGEKTKRISHSLMTMITETSGDDV